MPRSPTPHLVHRWLPDEVVTPGRARDVACSALLPLLLFVAVNLLIAAVLQERPSNRGYAITAAKWDLLSELQAPVDTLIVGDSSCNQAVRPAVLAARLGGRALNLCTTGDSIAVGDAWMVSAYLKRFGRPARVLVMHAYDVWARDEHVLRRQAWVFGRHRQLFLNSVPELSWSTEEQVLLRIGAFVPMYTQPLAARGVLMEPHRALSRKPFVLSRDGFMATRRASPRRVQRDASSHLRHVGQHSFRMSAENRAALAELTRLSESHGFALHVAHSPLYDRVWARRSFRRYHAQVSAQIEKVVRAAPAATLVSRLPVLYPAAQMEKVDHLVGAATRAFSERVASEIARIEHARDGH